MGRQEGLLGCAQFSLRDRKEGDPDRNRSIIGGVTKQALWTSITLCPS